jgi:hypothetical protein
MQLNEAFSEKVINQSQKFFGRLLGDLKAVGG